MLVAGSCVEWFDTAFGIGEEHPYFEPRIPPLPGEDDFGVKKDDDVLFGIVAGESLLAEPLPVIDRGLTRFDGHLSLEVLLPRKDVCDASCETAGVPASSP